MENILIEKSVLSENGQTLPCDSILLLGDKDHVGKVAAYNKRWSYETGYPLMIIKNAAHNSNDDKPEEVNKIIEDFLLSIG